MNLAAYLTRIGARRPDAPSAAVLREIHRLHRGAIPFENLDILLGRFPNLDLPSLEAKLVDARRGGYCFEQNTLFAAVLEELGYPVQRLVARVVTESPVVPRPRTHMMLLAEAEGIWWLADVGFGAWGLLEPVPLREGSEERQGQATVRLRRDSAGLWTLSCPECPVGPDLYQFDLTPQVASDYDMANFYTACHAESRFRQVLTVQRATNEARIIVRNRELITSKADGTSREPIADDDALLRLLEEQFGLVFPPQTRFPLPA